MPPKGRASGRGLRMDERIRNKILVVEESIAVNMEARDLLWGMGFGMQNIYEAYDGEEGLKLARRVEFDLIISGWNTPVVNGLGLLHAIREEEKTKDVPFLMLTGDEDRIRVGEAVRAGATGFLPKPFNSSDFTEKIWTIFRETGGDFNKRWEKVSRPAQWDEL